MITAFVGWLTFWVTYWTVQNILPYDIRSKLIIPSQNVAVVVFRNMMLSLPFSLVLWNYAPDISSYICPNYVYRFALSCIIMDVWFYCVHRLMHSRQMYWLHKQHHQFHIPYPLMAVYCSAFEALFCDVLAIGMGPTLLRMNMVEMIVWMFVMAVHSLILHSDLIHGKTHNRHHKTNRCDYGLIGIVDSFM